MLTLQIPNSASAQEKQYLWLPVVLSAEKFCLRVFLEDTQEQLYEFNLRTGTDTPDYYSPVDLTRFAGQTLRLEGDLSSEWFSSLRLEGQKPPVQRKTRPLLHFTPDHGWINDPNGLIYHNGCYHLYFQYYPFDLEWGDMHWGHAVSRDLLHWTQEDTALFPDESGTMFSGSAFADTENQLGYGAESLLLYYTAAGSNNNWSEGKPFTQRIAVLPQGVPENQPPVKTGIVAVDWIADGNRDPKVFRHEESNAYILVLYLDKNDFAVFRSANLTDWEMSQRLTLPEAWECPDLFCLPVEQVKDGEIKATGEKKWTFWTADGYYFTGSFDGWCFTPDSERKSAYCCKMPYAAQTYQGIPDRTVSIAWLRTTPKRSESTFYTGSMSIPMELSLLQTEQGLSMRMPPVRELSEAIREKQGYKGLALGETELSAEISSAFEMDLRIPAGEWTGEIRFAGQRIKLDGNSQTAAVDATLLPLLAVDSSDSVLDLRLLADNGIAELRGAHDTMYFVWEYEQAECSLSLWLDRELPEAQVEIALLA